MTENPALRTSVCDILACRYPIPQAGMGGVARAELVAGTIETVPGAAARIAEIAGSARKTLARLQLAGMQIDDG